MSGDMLYRAASGMSTPSGGGPDLPTMRCIFCDQERPGSEEHVFPLAISGRLITDRVCKPCNSQPPLSAWPRGQQRRNPCGSRNSARHTDACRRPDQTGQGHVQRSHRKARHQGTLPCLGNRARGRHSNEENNCRCQSCRANPGNIAARAKARWSSRALSRRT